MHSSRMRATRLLTVSHGIGGGGSVCLGYVCLGVSTQAVSAQVDVCLGECLSRGVCPGGLLRGCLPRGCLPSDKCICVSVINSLTEHLSLCVLYCTLGAWLISNHSLIGFPWLGSHWPVCPYTDGAPYFLYRRQPGCDVFWDCLHKTQN